MIRRDPLYLQSEQVRYGVGYGRRRSGVPADRLVHGGQTAVDVLRQPDGEAQLLVDERVDRRTARIRVRGRWPFVRSHFGQVRGALVQALPRVENGPDFRVPIGSQAQFRPDRSCADVCGKNGNDNV